MKKQGIQYLKISNFKSIDSLELKNMKDFSVFAGANGSGKSNFFDALDFVSRFIRNGITDALRWHGGFDNIHSVKRHPNEAQRFEFEIKYTLPSETTDKNEWYRLGLHNLSDKPEIEESISQDDNLLFERQKGKIPCLTKGETRTPIEGFSTNYSGFHLFSNLFLYQWLSNLHLYRIEPKGASAPAQSDQDSSLLKYNGHNLPHVLRRLEQNKHLRETILEWMETMVPGIEQIKTSLQLGGTAILFKEHGTDKQFPAHMMSDGTIYALSLLVAVLDMPSDSGLTLIEEPERGLHPQVIFELIDLMRTQASNANPLWMTTHSESVVRRLQLDELWLVDKKEGRTQMKAAASGHLQQQDLAPLGVDEAWLSDLLGGGLPW